MHHGRLNWDNLKVFLAVARTGALVRAGKQLSLDQTTVSRRLKKLEATIGATLFVDDGPNKRLTHAGRNILKHVEKVEGSVFSALAAGQSACDRPSGNAVISAPGNIVRHMLINRLHELLRYSPDVCVHLNVEHDIADLSRMEADIAIRLKRPKNGDYAIRKIGEIQYSVYRKTSKSPTHDWIGFSGDLANIPEVKWIEEQVGGSAPVMRTNDPSIMLDAIETGLAAGILPVVIGEKKASLERVGNAPIVDRDIWLVTRMDTRDTPRIIAVNEWIMDCFRSYKQSLTF